MGEADRPARKNCQPRGPGTGFRRRCFVTVGGERPLTRAPGKLFAVAQIELPGRLGPDDGRYLEQSGELERVVVLETVGMLPPARRNKRRPKPGGERSQEVQVPLTVVTVVFADLVLGSEEAAAEWLGGLAPAECDGMLDEAFDSLDRLLAAQAAATGQPYARPWGEADALAARVGYADGDRAYAGELVSALSVDVRGGAAAPRRERLERAAPSRRVAAVLRGREQPRASELLVPRVRADFDADRLVEAAAAIEVAAALTLTELGGLAEDREHLADVASLEAMLPDLASTTEQIVDRREPWPGLDRQVGDALAVAERMIRRVHVLDL